MQKDQEKKPSTYKIQKIRISTCIAGPKLHIPFIFQNYNPNLS